MCRVNPLKLTKMLNRSIGNIDFAMVLPDGNLLVGCNKEEQASKVLKLKEIGGIKVVSTSRVGGTGRAPRGSFLVYLLILAWRRLKVN